MSKLPTLASLLTESGLHAKAEQIDEDMYRMQWGSAIVMVAAGGHAVVATAPLFPRPPIERIDLFYRRLLEYNATMGGMASFAIQPDGWVVLHAGRSRKGLDAQELAVMVSGVGRFADEFDDQLHAEFFARNATSQVDDNNIGPTGDA